MTSKPVTEPCASLCGHSGFGSTLQASAFRPPDLNIKALADLHSCDAARGAARFHRSAHVLINMAPTELRFHASAISRPHFSLRNAIARSTCAGCVAFTSLALLSAPIPPLMVLSPRDGLLAVSPCLLRAPLWNATQSYGCCT